MVVSIDFYQLLDKIDNVSIWIINAELSIYKRSQGYELGTIENKSSKWQELDLNSGPPDCESDALTTRPRCHKLKCKEMIFLNKLWWPLQHLKYHDTSTILSTQGWINSIATSHSKMGSVLKVWTKPRWKRHQRGWNWHTFQPTSLPPTTVRIIILKTDTSRVIIKYRPTKTNPKYFLPENCHLNGPI